LIQLVALDEVARFARERGMVSVIDNTLATPINFRPVEHGFDLVVHSATKYLNGHSDIVAGAVAGSAARVTAVSTSSTTWAARSTPTRAGCSTAALKTLAVRVRYQSQSALEIASFLAGHPRVVQVHYPGLERHPHHARARQWLAATGGMLSFEIEGGAAAADQLFRRLTLPAVRSQPGRPRDPDHAAGHHLARRPDARGPAPPGHHRRADPPVGRPRVDPGPDRRLRRRARLTGLYFWQASP